MPVYPLLVFGQSSRDTILREKVRLIEPSKQLQKLLLVHEIRR